LEITTAVVETNIWRLLDVLKEATFFLTNKGIENPRLNAEMLLAHILGLNRIDLYLRFEQPLNQTERQSYKTVLRRRVDGEPLQYIISETEFFSLLFSVCKNVLIPRPETELLVEAAIQTIKEEWSESPVRCLDIGTGSGNIAIALAKNLQHAEIIAVDISDQAIAIAKRNAEKNEVADRITFQISDVMQLNFVKDVEPPFHVICSNPPYIASSDFENLPKEIRDFEPRQALDGGPDGLKFYQRFAEAFPKLVDNSGTIFLEIGETQAEKIQNIFTGIAGFKIQIKKDLAQKDRLMIGRYETPAENDSDFKERA